MWRPERGLVAIILETVQDELHRYLLIDLVNDLILPCVDHVLAQSSVLGHVLDEREILPHFDLICNALQFIFPLLPLVHIPSNH